MKSTSARKILSALLVICLAVLIVPMLVTPVGAETKTYTMHADDLEAFDAGTKADGETLKFGTDDYFTICFSAKTKVDGSNKTFDDGVSATQRIAWGGNTKIADPVLNAVKIEPQGSATLKIWWVSGGNERQITIYKADGSELVSTTVESVKNALYISTLEIPEGGTYYVGNTGGSNYFFQLQVTEEVAAKAPDTVAQTTSAGDLKAVDLAAGVSGNMLVDASFHFHQYNQRTDPNGDGKYNDGAEISGKTQIDAFTVFESGSTDGYAVFAAGQFMDGTSQWNFQHTVTVANDKLVPLTNDSYYVVDLDMATASEMIEGLSLSLCNRDASGGGFPFGNVKFSDFVKLTNEWIHFTAVGSIKTNTVYVFVNGQYVGTSDYAANPSVLGGKTAEEYGLHAQGIKVEVPYEDGNPAKYNIFKGQSTAFDNLSRRNFTDAESIAALDAIIGSETKDLTQWAGYLSGRTGSLRAYVEIDGVQYTDLNAASKVLVGNITKTVNVLNSFPSGLYVNCDATINMNGCTGNIYAAEGSTVTEADGVVTVDAPYIQEMTIVGTTSTSDAKNAIVSDVTDNYTLYFTGTKTNHQIGFANAYVVTNNNDGNKYLIYMDEGVTNSSNSYYEPRINGVTSTNYTYDANNPLYMVIDVDMARLSAVGGFGIASVVRNGGGSGLWGSGFQLSDSNIGNCGIGEFIHLTLVYDYHNNVSYMFANGQLTKKNANGPMSAAGHSNWVAGKDTIKPEAIRFAQNPMMSVAVDNMGARFIQGDKSLADALAANDITKWTNNVYTEGYDMPECAAIAYVNGDAVYTDEHLQTIFERRAELNVEIVADTEADFVITAKAVVNTNGLVFNGTAKEGGTQSVEGNVHTFVGPFTVSGTHALQSSSSTNKGFFSHIQAQGTLPLIADWSPAKADHVNMYLSTDNNTGNVYMTFQPKEGTKAYQDIQIGESLASPITIDFDDYYVVDLDIATENEIPALFYITSQIYPASGPNSKDYPFLVSFHPKGFIPEDGYWHHLTIVGDLAENRAWIFVDGVLIDDERTKDYYAYNATDEQLQEWGGLQLYSIKMTNDTNANGEWDPSTSVAIDSLSLRYFTDGTEIENGITAGNISGWSQYQQGIGGALPEVAVIDGVKYHNVKTASAALNAQTETAHEVELQKVTFANIVTNSSANVVKHGFNTFVANAQPEKIGDMLLASNFYIEGDSYVRINTTNYAGLTVGALWYSSDWMTYETVYYPFGTKISYVGEIFELKKNVIEDGMLFDEYWTDYLGTKIEEFPVAEKNGSYMYVIGGTPVATDITVQGGLKYNLSLYANFDMNLYVPVSTGVVGDNKVTIDGAQYVRLTQTVPATTMDGNAIFYVDFVVDGVTYSEKVTVNLLTYSQAVLEAPTVSHQMKRVIVAALAYVNEAQLLLNGAKIPGITRLLTSPAVAEFLVEDYTEYGEVNTDALKDVIAGAQLKLDGKVAFVLNVAAGFEGEITVAYNDYKGSEIKKTYSVKGGDSLVLDMKVYNLESILNITAGEVSGTYSLGGYIKGLVEAGTDAEFAQALFTYAKVAKDYKIALREAQ